MMISFSGTTGQVRPLSTSKNPWRGSIHRLTDFHHCAEMDGSDVDAFLDELLEKTSPPPDGHGLMDPRPSRVISMVDAQNGQELLDDLFVDVAPALVPFEDFEMDQMAMMMNSYFDLGPTYGNVVYDALDDGDGGDDLNELDEDELVEALASNQKYQDELRSILADLEHAEAAVGSSVTRVKQAQRRLWTAQRNRLMRPSSRGNRGAKAKTEISFRASLGLDASAQLQDVFPLGKAKDDGHEIRRAYMQIIPSCKRWNSRESQALVEAVRKSQAKAMVNAAVEECGGDASGLKEKLAAIQRLRPEELENGPVDAVDWGWVAAQLEARSPADCRIHWTLVQHPLINREEWSEDEVVRLAEIVKRVGAYGRWTQIAEELGTNRTAHACLGMYQRRLKPGFLKGRWTPDEDRRLLQLIQQWGDSNWPVIASSMEGRTGAQCMLRFQKTLDPSIRKGKWTAEEDELLRFAVSFHGSEKSDKRDWCLICRWVPGRTDVQCRERWMNILSPELKAEPFTPEEDERLCELLSAMNVDAVSWAAVQAKHFPGRTDSQIRRRWKMLARMKPQKKGGTNNTVANVEADGKKKRGRPRKRPLPEGGIEIKSASKPPTSPVIRRVSNRKAKPSKFTFEQEEDE